MSDIRELRLKIVVAIRESEATLANVHGVVRGIIVIRGNIEMEQRASETFERGAHRLCDLFS